MAYRAFKYQYTFEQRIKESTRILSKYPDRIPVICEKSKSSGNLPTIDKTKFLVPWDLTVANFIFIVRKRLNLRSEDAIFLFIGNNIMSTSCVIGEIYRYNKEEDGFLYIQYSKENTFG
jgi:GABA(A) receptor-associated protein